MGEWDIFTTIVYVVTFLITVVTLGVSLSKVIQKNTIAINTLTEQLKELTKDNKKDHERYDDSISKLDRKVALLEQKHTSDIELIQHDLHNMEE